jgi:glycosyltransferase involved in cell wall biosynthesis
MKILYLCSDLGVPVLGRKGAAVHVRELVAAFGRAGHDVVLAAQLLNKSPWEEPARIDAPLLQIAPSPAMAGAVAALKEFNNRLGVENPLPGELRRILYNRELETELKRRFEAEPPDLIYERASLFATAGISLARQLRSPIILELNAPLAQEQATYRTTGLSELAAQVERWTLSHADAVLTVSEPLRQHVLALGVAPDRVHVLPNGVNPALFHPAAPDKAVDRRWHLDGGPVVGFVGGLRPWHGVEVLPLLLERLATRHNGVRLVVAGDGPLRSELERQLEQRGLRSKAVITGLLPHDEIPTLIRRFDVAVAPYSQANHAFYFSPLKIFEYMACGAPVVAPRLGQIAELLRHGETGLLYSAGDVDALAACCDQLLAEPAVRRRIGTAAAQFIASRFTWDHNVQAIVKLARTLLSPNAKLC